MTVLVIRTTARQPASSAEIVAVPVTVDGQYGATLAWTDPLGRSQRGTIWARDVLVKRRWEEALAELVGSGLAVYDQKRLKDEIREAIATQAHALHVLATDRLGWHEIDGEAVFVLPDESVGGDVRYIGEPLDVGRKGDPTAWAEGVAGPAEQAWPAGLALMTSLSVPLLSILSDTHPPGIHLWGDSSTGKTTSLRVAASVWGSWRIARAWRATIHGLEAVAERMSDLPLILDEIGEVEPRVLDHAIYMLADGQGKSRATRTGGAATQRRWRTIPISSGERPSSEILAIEVGRQMMGQAARMLDIHVKSEDFGDAQRARLLTMSCDVSYGHAGPAFVEAVKRVPRAELLRARDEDVLWCHEAAERAAARALTPVERRCLVAFARILLAGQVATAAHVLPWKEGSPMAIIKVAVERWISTRERPTRESDQISDRIRAWIDGHIDRLIDLDSHDMPRQPVGWMRRRAMGDADEVTVYLTGETLSAAAGGYPAERVARALEERSWLVRGKSRAQISIRVPQGGTRWVYAIRLPDETGSAAAE